MLDSRAQALIAPHLTRMAAALVARGVGANAVTLAGFGIGLAAALAIALHQPLLGLALLLASRLCDGLDGAVARLTRPTDRGAFLDITLDFMFYASIPLAFALADPQANALAAAVLLAAFIGTSSSFLAFAVMAERRGLRSTDFPTKGLYYLGGLTEATETLLCFALMCLWPAAFAVLAFGFAALCGLTWLARLHAGWSALGQALLLAGAAPWAALVSAGLLAGAGSAWAADAPARLQPLVSAGSDERPPAPWRVTGLPLADKPVSQFKVVSLEGQRVLRVEASNSYGTLIHALPDIPGDRTLSWRWRLDEAVPASNLRQKAGDDSPVKVCAMFDMPMSAVPFAERQVLRLARLTSHEELPSATVCYVWDNHLPAGTVLDNAFTRRLRMIVLHGPEAPLHSWQSERRDLKADFMRLFGDEVQELPALRAVAIGADADNTHGHSVAHVVGVNLD